MSCRCLGNRRVGHDAVALVELGDATVEEVDIVFDFQVKAFWRYHGLLIVVHQHIQRLRDCAEIMALVVHHPVANFPDFAAIESSDHGIEPRFIIRIKGNHHKFIQQQFAHYEQIKRFTLLPEPFSMERGELTNTLKLKRAVVAKNYSEQIEKMYEESEK